MSKCLRFTDENFSRQVLENDLPVFVDFWGSWCPPCKMVEPVIEELAEELNEKLIIGKLNVDQNPLTRSMFKIGAAPTFMIFQEGKPLNRAIGAHSKKQLLNWIDKTLSPDHKTAAGKQRGGVKVQAVEGSAGEKSKKPERVR